MDTDVYDKENEENMNDNEMVDDQRLTDDMPFVAVQDRFMNLRAGVGNNKPLIDAFFKEEARDDFYDFYNEDDENRSSIYLKKQNKQICLSYND